MKVFSENIYLFTLKCEKILKDIIQKETDLKLRRSRFEYNNYTYPLHIIIFEQKNKLGYFDPHTYQIGLNLELLYLTKEHVLTDIIRHEFAHYLTYLKHGSDISPHGEEFKKVCSDYNWNSAISKAQMDIELENANKTGQLQSEKLISKIKALLNLASSENVHEAELATLKANQLLLKHNIKFYHFSEADKKTYSKVVLESKRKNTKLSCIYDILKHFMVRPVFIYGKNLVRLEVTGNLESLELAEYIAHFLDRELELQWNKIKSHKVKGLRAKNSFFSGFARGYDEKMQQTKESFDKDQVNALIKIEQDLDEQMNKIYRRLSHSSANTSIDLNAFRKGKSAGKNLTINKSIISKNKTRFLTWGQS